MTEESSTMELVLCKVCGNYSSGFHYGAHTCSACSQFFRRCLDQKVAFNTCKNNHLCIISHNNPKKCNYCRLKVCISIGMHKNAIQHSQFTIRLREEIIALQEINSQDKNSNAEQELMASILKAYKDTCHSIRAITATLTEKPRTHPQVLQPLSKLFCPLCSVPFLIYSGFFCSFEQLSDQFSPLIRGVMEFAMRIPCFRTLQQCDQVLLFKDGVFEVLLVKLACMFESQDKSLICLNGEELYQDSIEADDNAKVLLNSMFIFAKRMNNLHLSDNEVVLFCSILLMAADLPGLVNFDEVLKVQGQLKGILKISLSENHPENPTVFSDLMKMIDDLRVMNFIHFKRDLKQPVNNFQLKTVGALMERIAFAFVENSSTNTLPLDLRIQNDPAVVHPPVTNREARSKFNVQQKNEWGTSTSNYERNTADSKNDSEPLTTPVTIPVGDIGSQIPSSSYVYQDHGPSNPNQAVTSLCTKRPAESDVPGHRESYGALFVNSSTTSRIDSCPRYYTSPSSNSSIEENKRNLESDKQESTVSVFKPSLLTPPVINTQTLMGNKYKKFGTTDHEADTFSNSRSQSQPPHQL